MNKNLLVVGLQWGDEGKGKVIDALSEQYDAVIRFQGGANAGHTVMVNNEKYVLHLIPSGILHEGKQCIIANGVVVDPESLMEEIEGVEAKDIDVEGRLWISDRAHVVLPYHKILDGLQEAKLGNRQIQTTRRGIGPCYADKAERIGIRFAEFIEPDVFRTRLAEVLKRKNKILTKIFDINPIKFNDIWEPYSKYAERLRPFVKNTEALIHNLQETGKTLLFEGAQGTMLDVNYGTYPYVTSSNVCSGGATVGAGVAPSSIHEVMGIVKAYCSRVGGGPFPTEQDNDIGNILRERGNEYGSTTGRPRRCGWLDMVALNYSAKINGATGFSLMLMDVLSGFEEIKICTAYELNGEKIDYMPAESSPLEKVKPVYKTLSGWSEDITHAKRFEELPKAASDYVIAIENMTGVPVKMVSVGPGRSQVIHRS